MKYLKRLVKAFYSNPFRVALLASLAGFSVLWFYLSFVNPELMHDDPAGWAQVTLETALVPLVMFGFLFAWREYRRATATAVLQVLVGGEVVANELGYWLKVPENLTGSYSNYVPIVVRNEGKVVESTWSLSLWVPKGLFPREPGDFARERPGVVSEVSEQGESYRVRFTSNRTTPLFPSQNLRVGAFYIPIHGEEKYTEARYIVKYSLHAERAQPVEGDFFIGLGSE